MTKAATRKAFELAVALAKEHQLEIGGFDLFPDGRVRIITARMLDDAGEESPFDRLEREGKI